MAQLQFMLFRAITGVRNTSKILERFEALQLDGEEYSMSLDARVSRISAMNEFIAGYQGSPYRVEESFLGLVKDTPCRRTAKDNFNANSQVEGYQSRLSPRIVRGVLRLVSNGYHARNQGTRIARNGTQSQMLLSKSRMQ